MNCKRGDLAIIIGSAFPENVGAIVRCQRFLGMWSFVGGAAAPAWFVVSDGRLLKGYRNDGVTAGYDHTANVADAILRPIRDGELPDETLTWAGKPETVSA